MYQTIVDETRYLAEISTLKPKITDNLKYNENNNNNKTNTWLKLQFNMYQLCIRYCCFLRKKILTQ